MRCRCRGVARGARAAHHRVGAERGVEPRRHAVHAARRPQPVRVDGPREEPPGCADRPSRQSEVHPDRPTGCQPEDRAGSRARDEQRPERAAGFDVRTRGRAAVGAVRAGDCPDDPGGCCDRVGGRGRPGRLRLVRPSRPGHLDGQQGLPPCDPCRTGLHRTPQRRRRGAAPESRSSVEGGVYLGGLVGAAVLTVVGVVVLFALGVL